MGIVETEKTPIPRLHGMFGNPNKQFKRLNKNPRVWVPLLIVTFISIIASTFKAISLKIDDIMLIPNMTMEEGEIVLALSKAFIAISGFITPVLSILFSTILLFIIVKLLRNRTSFKHLFSMNIYIAIIGAVGILINNLMNVVFDGNQTNFLLTSLAAVFQNQSILLENIELFSIWEYILTAIGLQKVVKLSKSISILITFVIFLLQIGFAYTSVIFFSQIGL